MKNKYHYKTPIGSVAIEEDGEAITGLWMEEITEGSDEHETELIKRAYGQLMQYFEGKRTTFDLPLHLNGTEFQKKVWSALCTIPYGETRSYGELAKMIGNPKASRAVGGANNKNPIMIFVPCHRVIGANGDLVGFGAGIAIKKQLLVHEGTKDQQNSMCQYVSSISFEKSK